MENTTIHELLKKYRIEGYFRYVDDTLVVHNNDNTNIYNVLEDFNNLTPKLKFTLDEEQNNQINFLDITIKKNQKGLLFEVYRKPTTTDIIIPNDSCHPNEHKTAAIRYYRNRLGMYRLTPKKRKKLYDRSWLIINTMPTL